MGERGPTPRREDERRRRNKSEHPIVKMGPDELQDLPFEVDLAPEPPDPATGGAEDEEWHPVAAEFWRLLQADPARKWMTSADWGAALFVTESMSRDLRPQVVGVTEQGNAIKDTVPIKGANLSAYLKFMSMIGVTEAARLRIQKEITLFPTQPIDTEGNVIDINTARSLEVQ